MQGLIAAFPDRPLWHRALIAMGLGVLAGLGQAPVDLWWVMVLSLAVVFAIFGHLTRPAQAFWLMWWVGFGYFAFTLRWIIAPFLVDAAATGWMAPFAIVLMAAGAAVFWGLAGLAAAFAGPLGLVFALTLTEALRSLILTGFPWALIGHGLIDTPLAQMAAFVGPHGLTLVVCLLAWSVGQGGRRTLPVATFAVIGWIVLTPLMTAVAVDDDAPIVRIVQPNVPQDEKWDPALRTRNVARLMDLTSAGDRPALIVWPETAVPIVMNFAQDALADAAEAARGTPLILGINRQDGKRYYNAAVHLGPGAVPQAIYDKAHLAPFGEYIPGGEWLLRFGITGLAASEGRAFTAGGIQPLMEIPGIGPARILICYEGIFAEEIAHTDRPRLMVLITNDAWFGNGAGPAQHLAQARLRAIEQGLPLVRAANTGISAMIDPRGQVTGALPLNTHGALELPLPVALPASLYTRFGDGPVIILALLSLSGLVLRARAFRH